MREGFKHFETGETQVPTMPPILLESRRCGQDHKLEDPTNLISLISTNPDWIKVKCMNSACSWTTITVQLGLPWWLRSKEFACQCRRHRRHAFDPWVRKRQPFLQLFLQLFNWRRKWQPTPVFLLGESPWTEEPGALQSIASQRVRHD